MYHPLAAGARLYRVTGPGSDWPTPVLGAGAYYTKGGRYNRVDHHTVYCSEDPLVVLAETAFYQALDWQRRTSLNRTTPLTYPFVSRHRLWCFAIDPAPPILDLENPIAPHQFQFSPNLLFNPSLNPRDGITLQGQVPSRDYTGTQELADEIRAYNPAAAGLLDPRPEGIKVPSVRLEKQDNFQPHLIALFLGVSPDQIPFCDRSNLLGQWELELEFLQKSPRAPINHASGRVDWRRPRFRLSDAGAAILPAYASRPAAVAYDPGSWHDFEVEFV